jgi:hypothetical protein
MKRSLFKLKQASRQAVKEQPKGALASDSSASPQELLQEEEFQWLSEIQNALSPYWSARLAR